MTRERGAAGTKAAVSPDAPWPLGGELRTLHIRCGSDLKKPLHSAGFHGDIGRMSFERDPLPGQGDLNVRQRILSMEGGSARVYERRPAVGRDGERRPPWTDMLTITDLGRAVLKGAVDYLSLRPPYRWVGGVQVGVGLSDWRWDEQTKSAVVSNSAAAGTGWLYRSFASTSMRVGM